MVGLIAGAILWGLTLGSLGTVGRSFYADVVHSGVHPILLAMIGGAIFNIANLLLVAAIDIAGLAVAFPLRIGLALVVGAGGSFIISPQRKPLLLLRGLSLFVPALALPALAYR